MLLYSIHASVLNICWCTHYTSMYSVYASILSICWHTQYILAYSVYAGVLSTPSCTHGCNSWCSSDTFLLMTCPLWRFSLFLETRPSPTVQLFLLSVPLTLCSTSQARAFLEKKQIGQQTQCSCMFWKDANEHVDTFYNQKKIPRLSSDVFQVAKTMLIFTYSQPKLLFNP